MLEKARELAWRTGRDLADALRAGHDSASLVRREASGADDAVSNEDRRRAGALRRGDAGSLQVDDDLDRHSSTGSRSVIAGPLSTLP